MDAESILPCRVFQFYAAETLTKSIGDQTHLSGATK